MPSVGGLRNPAFATFGGSRISGGSAVGAGAACVCVLCVFPLRATAVGVECPLVKTRRLRERHAGAVGGLSRLSFRYIVHVAVCGIGCTHSALCVALGGIDASHFRDAILLIADVIDGFFAFHKRFIDF